MKKASPSRSFANVLLALLILFFVFAFRYTVPDRYAFFLPFYCLVSILIGVGCNLLVTWPRHKILAWLVFVLALLSIPTYVIAPIVAQKIHFKLPTKRSMPYRNDYIWFLRPWKTDHHDPGQFTDEVFNTVEDNAVIYADGTTLYPLLYAQEIKSRRSDIKIVSFHANRKNPVVFNEQTVPKLLAETSVYVVSPLAGYCPRFLLEQYEFEQAGILWKVVEKQAE